MNLNTDVGPDYMRQISMFLEENRIASFKKWVFDDSQPCNATKMAEAGFYSVATKEDPDSVQCFLCSKSLDGWEAEDDPWREHLSHTKNCLFAKLHLPEKKLTLNQVTDLRKEQFKNIFIKYFDDMMADLGDTWCDLFEQNQEHSK